MTYEKTGVIFNMWTRTPLFVVIRVDEAADYRVEILGQNAEIGETSGKHAVLLHSLESRCRVSRVADAGSLAEYYGHLSGGNSVVGIQLLELGDALPAGPVLQVIEILPAVLSVERLDRVVVFADPVDEDGCKLPAGDNDVLCCGSAPAVGAGGAAGPGVFGGVRLVVGGCFGLLFLFGGILVTDLSAADMKMLEDLWAALDLHESVKGLRGKLALAGNTFRARWKYKEFTDITWLQALWIQAKGFLFIGEPKL